MEVAQARHAPGPPVRDPFAWREALTPTISPAVSARSSAADSTPRSSSPFRGGNSARSSRSNAGSGSNASARSQGSLRAPCGYDGGSARGYGGYDGLSARTSSFATPEPSARSSDFHSLNDFHDSSPMAYSARMGSADFGTVYEDALVVQKVAASRDARKHRACAAAALAAFAESEDCSGVQAGVPLSFGTPPTLAPSDGMALTPSPLDAPASSLDPRAVFSAARHGKHKEVEGALAAGFDPSYADSFGNTLFHVACQNGNKRISKAAIKYGGDMDAQNAKGHTGLHFLFAYGYADIAEYFIGKGANEHVRNISGRTAREGIG